MRKADIKRQTNETKIDVSINLDGSGISELKTNLPFLEHMLDQVVRHGNFDLKVIAEGDLEIDAHHTVEDIGITLGQAVNSALGDKFQITRFGNSYVPLDESLSRVVIDFSGRPGLEFNVNFPRSYVGDFDVELFYEFFQGFVNHANCTLHIDNLRGKNTHHIIETIFKSFGRSLRMAVAIDSKLKPVAPSTKGIL